MPQVAPWPLSFPNTGGTTVSSDTLPAIYLGPLTFRQNGSERINLCHDITITRLGCQTSPGQTAEHRL